MKFSLSPLAKSAALACLIVAVLFSAGCPSHNAQHELNRVNKEFSDGLSELQADTQSLNASKQVSDEDAAAIYHFVSEATADHKVLTAQLRGLPALDGANAAQAVAFVQSFVAKIHNYNLHVSSDGAQKKVNLFFASFDAGSNSLIALLESLKPAVKTSENPHQDPMKAAIDPESEIAMGLMAFSALVKLIGKWKANGALSDQDLQDACDAEDDETNKAALAALQALGK